MGMTKTFIQKQVQKRWGENADLIDSGSYASDSTLSNLKDDVGIIPVTQSELNARGAAERRQQWEEEQAWKEKIAKQSKRMKSKSYSSDVPDEMTLSELNAIRKEKARARKEVESIRGLQKKQAEKKKAGFYKDIMSGIAQVTPQKARYKPDKQGKMLSGREARKVLRKVEDNAAASIAEDIAKKERKRLGAATRYTQLQKLPKELRKKVSQKLRTDRLAKKELRVAELKQRLRRLKHAERQQARVQRSIARVLQKKRPENLMSNTEMKVMYRQGYSGQNDGNILHAQNFFTQSDARTNTVKMNSNILSAPNYLMQQKEKKITRQKWF